MIKDLTEIQFPNLGWTFHIDPTAFTIGSVQIQWYGIIIAIGLALAAFYCLPRMKRFGIDSDRAIDPVLGGVIGGVIGARLYYVIMKWDEYKKDSFKETFLAVINTRNGGLAIYGGIIGALAVGLMVCKIKKIKMLPMLDIASIGFLIGQGIGRWGNFVNQEAFGTNTDSLLGMTGGRIQHVISSGMQLGGDMYANGLDMMWEKTVHPCFLYESLWCILGFLLLSFWSKFRKYDGQLLLMYMAWYGAERAVVEGLRTDSLMIGSIRISQAISIIILITSVILQVIFGFKVKRDPESFVLYASTEESRMLIEESRRKSMGMKGINAYHPDEDDEIGDLSDDDDELLPVEDDDDDEIGELPPIEDDDEENEKISEDKDSEYNEEASEGENENESDEESSDESNGNDEADKASEDNDSNEESSDEEYDVEDDEQSENSSEDADNTKEEK